MKNSLIKIAYSGQSVDDGTMDVRDFAPALLAFGQFIEEANQILNGDDSRIKVLVRADMQKGSFEIGLEIMRTLSEEIKSLIGLAKETSIQELLGIIGLSATISGITLIELIRMLKGKKPKSATIIETGNVRVEISAEDKEPKFIEVKENVVRLYQNVVIRQKFEEILEP